MRGLERFAVAVPVSGIAAFATFNVELLAHITVGVPAGPGALRAAFAEKSLKDDSTFCVDTLSAAGIRDGIVGHIGEAIKVVFRTRMLEGLADSVT